MRALFFFFSSRRRHTRLQGDWSSDVCSSDLCRRRLRSTISCTGFPALCAVFRRACASVCRSEAWRWFHAPERHPPSSDRLLEPVSDPGKPHSRPASNREKYRTTNCTLRPYAPIPEQGLLVNQLYGFILAPSSRRRRHTGRAIHGDGQSCRLELLHPDPRQM